MKTIAKAQYLYLKSKKNAERFKNELVELTDEEYEDLIQYAPNITPEQENEKIYAITFKDGDEIVRRITGPMGTYVSVPYVEKEGYEFLGWSLDGEKVTMPIDGIYDSDITYIAVWEKIEQEEPIEPPVIEPEEEDPENSEKLYELYENDINELILVIKKQNSKFKIYSKDNISRDEYELEVNYGENNITKFINYCYIDDYSYEKQYKFTLIENNNINYKILFTLKNKKDFYSYSIINEPKFNFYINSYDNFSLKLISPLIIKYNYNNKEIVINDINKFNLYISEFNSKGGAIRPYKKINYVKSNDNNNLNFNYNFIDQYPHSQFNVNDFDNSYLSLRISYDSNIIRNNYLLNIDITKYLSSHNIISYNYTDINLFEGPQNGALMYKNDKYNVYKTYGKQLINNIENNNANNIDIINYYIKCTYENNILINNLDSVLNDDIYDHLCQIFNCQQNVLNIYYTYDYSQIKNFKDDIYVNNDLIIGDYKKDKVTYSGWYTISALIGENYLEKYNKFKLFVTINNIDYIILNCGWDITTKTEHYLINSETGEKIMLNE